MKKVLFVATVSQHFFYFHQPCFEMFKNWGWEVDVACSGNYPLQFVDERFNLPFARSPLSKQNSQAFKQLKKIISDNNYDIIHCHTPVGGALTRLAAKKSRKSGTKVIYTAHGFHFFKGASTANWCLYYPIERILAHKTDCLITINDEDFEIAKKKLRCGEIEHVHGVGCDNEKFCRVSQEEKQIIRNDLGYDENETILIYVAELNKNKNQGMLVRTVKELADLGQNIRLLLVGQDNFDGTYKKLAEELKVEDRVDFLGKRDDVEMLLKACDIAVASSLREGLPLNIMEAMATGLPVAAGDNRGHRALISHGETGFLVEPNNSHELAEKISLLIDNRGLYEQMSDRSIEAVVPFSKERVRAELEKIYSRLGNIPDKYSNLN